MPLCACHILNNPKWKISFHVQYQYLAHFYILNKILWQNHLKALFMKKRHIIGGQFFSLKLKFQKIKISKNQNFKKLKFQKIKILKN